MCEDSIRVVHPLFQEVGDGAIPISSLQIEVQKCSVKLACVLNHKFHSRLPIVIQGNIDRNRHKICFAFIFKNRYYGTALWSSPVAANRLKNGEKLLELRRLALADDCPKNTASRVIKVMIKEIKKEFPDIIELISYQDTESHLGTIYKASNWIKSEKDVEYSDWAKSRKRNKAQTKSKKIKWRYPIR